MFRRPPCVAGRFYPGEKEALKKAVEGLLGLPGPKEIAASIIAPHAGYMYSGAVAGAVYSAVNIPDTIVLIGPNHTGLGEKASLMSSGVWEIPTGAVKINNELASLLLDSKAFSDDRFAHMMEHSLEVQLPFIKSLNPNAAIIPITVMHADRAACSEMGAKVAEAVRAYDKETLIIVSSDMNHYEPDKRTREKDRLAIDRVLKLDADGLLKVTDEKDISMCGVIPAAIALNAAKLLGAKNARLVKYSTSGETSGDFEHVVGYAGIVIN